MIALGLLMLSFAVTFPRKYERERARGGPGIASTGARETPGKAE
jgi:hypothetical protein